MMMEFIEASFLEEIEKTKKLEMEEHVIIVGEVSHDSSWVLPFPPNQNLFEKLKLESDALIHQRMQEKCFRNMSIKHVVQYKKL
jgi:3-methyladenine DNA glycosylase Tag